LTAELWVLRRLNWVVAARKLCRSHLRRVKEQLNAVFFSLSLKAKVIDPSNERSVPIELDFDSTVILEPANFERRPRRVDKFLFGDVRRAIRYFWLLSQAVVSLDCGPKLYHFDTCDIEFEASIIR
jgi:hypothetical protein